MNFNWRTFLARQRVEFFESGPNVARGNIAIRCPWCGASDSSAHMGISEQGKGWGCWRNVRHRGGRPERLVAALLNISWAEAHDIVEEAAGGRPALPATGFGDEIGKLLGRGPQTPKPRAACPSWPREMKPLVDDGAGRQFFDYLLDRRGNYTLSEVEDLAALYGLRYATTGVFKYRVIIPVEDSEGLVSWTGRHIGRHPVRYRSLSPDPEKARADFMPVARKPINHCILNQAELENLEEKWPLLLIGEGPLDGLRIDYFGHKEGCRGTCLFGLAVHDMQVDALAGIVDNFEHKILLLDKGEDIAALNASEKLAPLGFRTWTLDGDKDPGDMLPADIKALARGVLRA